LSTTSEPKSTAHEVSDLEGRHIQNGVQAKKEHEFTLHTEHLNQQLDGKVGEGIKKEENIDNIGEKRGFEEMGAAIAKHFAGVKAASKPLASTADEDEPQEFEMFESRQQFLNYCQTNHFQFDELRRAKHTTMMVLFQLHNPNAPKFLENCGACFREIAHGSRYHCNECANFNLCEDCYEPVTTGQFAQQNARFSHDSSHSFSPINVEIPNNEQKNREERSRSIKVHLELLAHAASCDGPPGCALNNCQRMKKLFEHVRDCNVIPKKACKICTRILTLLAVHARLCTVRGSCPLPFCDRIREKNRRRRQQQQLMDDRRRQTQNKLYRANEEGDL
jgi:E1A/CREB-binding protein